MRSGDPPAEPPQRAAQTEAQHGVRGLQPPVRRRDRNGRRCIAESAVLASGRAPRANAGAGTTSPARDNRGMWPRSARELVDAQSALATAEPPPWRAASTTPVVGACVVCFPRGQHGPGARGDRGWAAAVAWRSRRVVAEAIVRGSAGGAYAPGLLALREGPLLEAAVRGLAVVPDVVLVDATGRDHPRGAGLAIQLGAVVGLASVGVTHRPLLAEGAWPAESRGATAALMLDGQRVAVWLRTRAGARPLAVHGGWRTSLDIAIEVVMATAQGHRTPEPLRHARRLARTARVHA
jgi:deoxyribonuclease V